MAMVDWQTEADEARLAAIALVEDLEAGRGLPVLDTTVPLGPSEKLHIAVYANCWWYGSEDVTYNRRHFLVFDSLPWLGLTAAASAIGNHRRRTAAESLAAPQWHPLGNQAVLVTNHRLFLVSDKELMPLQLTEIRPLGADIETQSLELGCDLPILIRGPWVPYLAVAVRHLWER